MRYPGGLVWAQALVDEIALVWIEEVLVRYLRGGWVCIFFREEGEGDEPFGGSSFVYRLGASGRGGEGTGIEETGAPRRPW